MSHTFVQVLIALLLLSSTGSVSLEGQESEERLIGWQGEQTRKGEADSSGEETPAGEDAQSLTAEAGGEEPAVDDSQPVRGKERFIETIAWEPRAFVYHNFLTNEECDYLVENGDKKVRPSLVVDAKTGASKSDSIRTSYGAAFGRGESPMIASIENKIAEWTHVPPSHGEALQVLRYMNGQKYDAHWDWFDDVRHKPGPGMDNRYATVLMYLSDPDEGGETTLPLANAIDEKAQQPKNASKCATKMGIAVKPEKGERCAVSEPFYCRKLAEACAPFSIWSALLFFDMNIEGKKGDKAALHASCPTLAGTKWTATKWIHNHPQGSYDPLKTAGRCSNIDADCATKARMGDGCNTPGMMGLAGRCRLECKDCRVCPPGDIICLRSNMKSKADSMTDESQ